MIAQNKAMTIIGWVLSGLVSALLLGMSAPVKLTRNPTAVEGMQKMGYPENALVPIGVAEAGSTILYLIPQTAVLGAVLLTGYLGGATDVHVRNGDEIAKLATPVVVGVLVWFALWLRDPRIRNLLPIHMGGEK
jgi:hypothetical protein